MLRIIYDPKLDRILLVRLMSSFVFIQDGNEMYYVTRDKFNKVIKINHFVYICDY